MKAFNIDNISAEVVILGHPKQSELTRLQYTLQHKFQHACVRPSLDDHPWRVAAIERRLTLLRQTPLLTHTKHLEQTVSPLLEQGLVAIFQAKHDEPFERHALGIGISGLFFEEEDTTDISQGVERIFLGELWFQRRILSQWINKRKKHLKQCAEQADQSLHLLTQREKTVINLLTLGARNKEIAAKLNISAHTVKAHIYSIFKKTNSRNRAEVVYWANRCFKALDTADGYGVSPGLIQ